MRTDEEYCAAAEWAENEMDLSRLPKGTKIYRGAAAAESGRKLLESALGGPEALERALRGERPDPD